MDGFAVLAEPTRREIVERLRVQERDVSSLVDELGISQSLASKHLRILREASVVEASVAGKRRVYRLSQRPLPDVIAWIQPYVQMWSTSFDRLGAVLDQRAASQEGKQS
jgi:DNA-binding transcriptional ArsR family regulator